MKSKIFFTVLLIYSIASFLSIRKLFGLEVGLGHNWDSPFSPLDISYISVLENLPYVWHGQLSLGFPIISSISTKVWWLLNSLVGVIFGGHLVAQVMILFLMVSGGVLMFSYVHQLLRKDSHEQPFFEPLCAGLFLMYSPVVFGHIVGGAFNQLFAMVVSILLLIVLQAGSSRKNTTRTAIEISLIFIFISVTLHIHLISALVTVIYVLFLYDWPLIRKIGFAIKITVSSLLLAAYWLLPELYGLAQANVTQKLKENISFGNLIVNVPSLSNALFANGYIRRFYDFMVIDKLYGVWKVAGLSLFLIIIMSVLLIPRTKIKTSKYLFFWLGLFLFFVNFATGFIGPLGPAVQFLYENFPPMSIFRSPQWWMMPLTICFSILIGLSFSRLTNFLRSKLLVKATLLILVIFVLHPFYLSGDLGIEKLYQRQLATDNWYKADHLDLYKVPADYKKAIDILANDNSDSKVFLLPLSLSPYFEETSYQRQGSGVDPILAYLAPKPVIFNDINVEYDTKSTLLSPEKKLYRDRSLEFLNLLGVLNAKYILLKKDYSPVFSNYRDYWDSEISYRMLMDNISQIGKVVVNGESTLLIELNNKYYWPHIYSPQKLFYVSGGAEHLTDIGEFVENEIEPGILFSDTASEHPPFTTEDVVKKGLIFEDVMVVGKVGNSGLNPKRFDFSLDIPIDGIYEVFVKRDSRDQKWEMVDQLKFNKGLRIYKLSEKFSRQNLLDRSGFIKGFQYDTSYYLSLSYKTKNNDALLTVSESEKIKVAERPLPSSDDDWVFYETAFRSFPSNGSAKVTVASAIFKDLRVEKNDEPQLILRLKNYETEKVDIPKIDSVRLNPTLYKVSVRNSKEPFVLIFSEAFNQGWRLYFKGRQIPIDRHKVANGFANSWIITKNDTNNESDYDLVIEFFPQRLFYLGLAVSLLSLLTSLVILINKRDEKQN